MIKFFTVVISISFANCRKKKIQNLFHVILPNLQVISISWSHLSTGVLLYCCCVTIPPFSLLQSCHFRMWYSLAMTYLSVFWGIKIWESCWLLLKCGTIFQAQAERLGTNILGTVGTAMLETQVLSLDQPKVTLCILGYFSCRWGN